MTWLQALVSFLCGNVQALVSAPWTADFFQQHLHISARRVSRSPLSWFCLYYSHSDILHVGWSPLSGIMGLFLEICMFVSLIFVLVGPRRCPVRLSGPKCIEVITALQSRSIGLGVHVLTWSLSDFGFWAQFLIIVWQFWEFNKVVPRARHIEHTSRG